MALTTIEQQQIIRGDYGPTTISLKDMVLQACVKAATEFVQNHNTAAFDETNGTPDNPEANAYASKIIAIAGQVFRADGAKVNYLVRVMVALLAENFDIGQAQNANSEAWDTQIVNRAFRVLELFAGVTINQKTAYDNL